MRVILIEKFNGKLVNFYKLKRRAHYHQGECLFRNFQTHGWHALTTPSLPRLQGFIFVYLFLYLKNSYQSPSVGSNVSSISLSIICRAPLQGFVRSICSSLVRSDGGSIDQDRYCELRPVQAEKVPPGVQEELPGRENR